MANAFKEDGVAVAVPPALGPELPPPPPPEVEVPGVVAGSVAGEPPDPEVGE